MKLRKEDNGWYLFYCEGCGCRHFIDPTIWTFNGDLDNPTVSPSILVRSGHYKEDHFGDCWCTYNDKHPENPSSFECYRCHSFVRNGMIEYLSDCSHSLAGQIVPLLDEGDWFK